MNNKQQNRSNSKSSMLFPNATAIDSIPMSCRYDEITCTEQFYPSFTKYNSLPTVSPGAPLISNDVPKYVYTVLIFTIQSVDTFQRVTPYPKPKMNNDQATIVEAPS